jgi:RND superfamily putative drug exporter
VLIDAFVIRATLVPAFMKLAGELNWWAPPSMRRIYDRFGISESEAPDRGEPPLPPTPQPVGPHQRSVRGAW